MRISNTMVTNETFARGKVTRVLNTSPLGDAGADIGLPRHQELEVQLLSGEAAGATITAAADTLETSPEYRVGDRVVVSTLLGADETSYVVTDAFRLPDVGIVLFFFVLLAVALGRKQGAMSLVGLAVSLAVLTFGVAPWILSGGSPLLASVVGGVAIAVVSICIAHGVSRRTLIALGATLLTLAIAVGLAAAAVAVIGLTGAGTEEAVYLKLGAGVSINLAGLLLGGMIIGVLGVLDDVTTTQVASIEEIAKADRTLGSRELYVRGLSVGREHIASLVNTLALAYAGAAFPLFLLLMIPGGPPLWVVLNSEAIVEEAARALVGGAALMLAVPISTLLAARFFARR